MKVEKIETNKFKLTFEVDAQTFEKGLQHSYNKNKGSFNIAGFRKGKAPRKIIEVQFGKEIFFEDAINYVLPEAYDKAIEENQIRTVAKPDIDVESISVEDGVVFTAEVYTKPGVVVGEYKGITYAPFDTTPTEEEISKDVNKTREKNSRLVTVTDRPIEMGDIVTIDYEGFLEGQPFEGGKAYDHDLTIGSKTFVGTFEEQLVGHNAEENLEITVTFPENYHSANLSGKETTFKVAIKEIKFKELPELNDEFAQDVSEFDTLEEYKEDIKAKISKTKSAQAAQAKENQIMTTLIENCTMEVPEVMVETQIDQLVAQFSNRLKSQGLPIDMYLQYAGMTEQSLRDTYRPNAELQVKGRLALEAVAKEENFELTEEEIDKELEIMAESYSVELGKLKEVLRAEDLTMVKEDILIEKALELVLNNAIETA